AWVPPSRRGTRRSWPSRWCPAAWVDGATGGDETRGMRKAHRLRIMTAVLAALAVAGPLRASGTASPAPPSPTPSPGPPQIDFPGQYAAAPADWRFPVWPVGCGRFAGEAKTACLE